MKNPLPLHDYQVADLAFYIALPRCLNLSDPGTGKTPSVCVMQQYQWQEEKTGTVWVMPKSLLKKNKDEIIRFTEFEPDDVAIVDGTKKQVDAAYASGAKVLLMGFDRFGREHHRVPDYIKNVHVDEIHMGFGGDGSNRTQGFYEAMTRMNRFIGMTGTLINGRLDSAYPAIKVIEPRYYPSYWAFMAFHEVKNEWTGKRTGWQNHQKLSQIFGRHAIRRTFESIYGAEAKVVLTELVEMVPKQREMYETFKEQAALELEKFFIDGTMPGAAFIRARQLMEHPNEFPDLVETGRFIDIMPGHVPGKEERLAIHFEDHERTGKPLIVYAAMVPQQRRILALAQKTGLRAALINGSTSAPQRAVIDEQFRRGELQCLVCSPAVAAIGFNWQMSGDKEVDHVIFASLDFQDTSYLQAYRRAMRGVRKSPLRITILEYEDSIDQRLFSIIKQKSEMAKLVDPTRPKLAFSAMESAA